MKTESLKDFHHHGNQNMQHSEESSDEEGEIEWTPVKTPAEAAEILHGTIFEFASVTYNLYLKDEANHPGKYEGKLKPSAKVFVVTALMRCWDNNKERLAEHYVNHVLNWKKYIDGRNADFFLNNNQIYVGFDGRTPKEEDIEFFKDLWRPNSTFALKADEKEQVFVYFDTMLHYAAEWKRLTNYVAIWEKKSNTTTNKK
jgi:hypothetical protein